MTPRLLALVALTALGCAGEDDYAYDYSVAVCDKTFECADDATLTALGLESAEQCYPDPEDPDPNPQAGEDCFFDKPSAKACLDGIETMTCDDYAAGDWPQPCSVIWQC